VKPPLFLALAFSFSLGLIQGCACPDARRFPGVLRDSTKAGPVGEYRQNYAVSPLLSCDAQHHCTLTWSNSFPDDSLWTVEFDLDSVSRKTYIGSSGGLL